MAADYFLLLPSALARVPNVIARLLRLWGVTWCAGRWEPPVVDAAREGCHLSGPSVWMSGCGWACYVYCLPLALPAHAPARPPALRAFRSPAVWRPEPTLRRRWSVAE